MLHKKILMNRFITINYPSTTDGQIQVSYEIEQTPGMQTISCCVEGRLFPVWLQLRKFSLCSLRERDNYIPLYNEVNDSKNMDTSLFIDMVYKTIMKLERFKLC